MKKIGLSALALVTVVGLGAFGYNAIQSSRTAPGAAETDSCCAAEEAALEAAALSKANACPFTQTTTDDCCGTVTGDETQTAVETAEGETKVAVSDADK